MCRCFLPAQVLSTNGLEDPATGQPNTQRTLTIFWVSNIIVLCMVALAEIGTLYYQAVKHAVGVAGALSLRLV